VTIRARQPRSTGWPLLSPETACPSNGAGDGESRRDHGRRLQRQPDDDWSADGRRIWLKTRLVDGAPHGVVPAPSGAEAAPHPTEMISDDITASSTLSGRWCLCERLPTTNATWWWRRSSRSRANICCAHPGRRGAHAIGAIGDRIDPHLYMSEIRTVAADALWLSSSYGYDCVAIHFNWKREPEAVQAITAEIEDLLLPLGARPHWGKVMHTRSARLAPLYPRMQAFRELAQSYDPEGKFRNDFLDAHIFG